MSRRADSPARLDPSGIAEMSRPGAVYLLPHHNSERFKVGWATHPMHRIQQLPEFSAQKLNLASAKVAWFTHASRAHQVERVLHRSLAPYNVLPDHCKDGHTEWFDTRGMALARRMIDLQPADADQGYARLLPLNEAPDAPSLVTPVTLAFEPNAMDTWYRVEDLWLRLGLLLPMTLRADREHRCLRLLGMRRLAARESMQLRSGAIDLETYRWTEDGQRRSLVTLMMWEQDHLLLHLTPTRQLRRWREGHAVADLLQDYLARRVVSLPPAKTTTTAAR